MAQNRQNGFRFSIDRGGTFTDVYAEVPGEPGFKVVKLLSVDPTNYDDAPREGIRRILAEYSDSAIDGSIDASQIEWIRMGTTVATNALLERNGAATALVVTTGFGDVLQIGNQDRPNLFDLRVEKPELLYSEVVEVDERLRLLRADETSDKEQLDGITGERFAVLTKPDLTSLRPRLQALLDRGIRSLGVVFMHAYACPQHEQAVGQLALELGFEQVSLSSQVIPMVKLVSRGDTTIVDAYLTPHIRDYLHSFKKGFKDNLNSTQLLFMQSDGGLSPARDFTGSRAILSGPAGGVVGYAMTTYNRETKKPVIGFDMGGTSTDVSRFGGEYEFTFETKTAGVRIQAPQLDIRTVAAGGGSRLFFDNGMFLVGPESAGAHPGPVCYRKNGYLTVTDANLILGRLQPDYFPKIFGDNEDQPLDYDESYKQMALLTTKINNYYTDTSRPQLTVEETALGFLEVANEVMVRPIREVSVMRGFDSKEHVLATFGGAGGQHSCAIARSLGITSIFIHRFGGILSAYGIGLADTVVEKQQPAAEILSVQSLASLEEKLAALQCETVQELCNQGLSSNDIENHQYLNLRYQGTDTAMMVERSEEHDFAGLFEKLYRREFGFELTGRDILVDDLRVRSIGKTSTLRSFPLKRSQQSQGKIKNICCYFTGGWQETGLYHLETLAANEKVQGPAILIQETGTILVEPGCTATITNYGDVEIESGKEQQQKIDTVVDPVQLSIFSNLFMSIAEQMGRMLQKTAISTNIKERLDFSCALFGPTGNLVANAPHVPVHLGAMSEAVKEQIRRVDIIRSGDVLVSNHPAAGGSHLPDITVMTPVFQGETIVFWVASRGHHADIGGISPGSMPPASRQLVEEGAAIFSFKLVEKNVFQEEGITKLLLAPKAIAQEAGRPAIIGTRLLSDNLSDLRAQVAANQKGIDLIQEMVAYHGLSVVQAYMLHVQETAEEAVRTSLCEVSRARGMAEKDCVTATEYLDDGSPIVLTLTIDRSDGSALFDFSGTGTELWGNLNAPKAVTQSAILYSLRCLVEKDIPLNHGCLLPIQLVIPEGCLLDPSPEAAVVGGNVLTSQRVVDVVLKAFGVAAGSQGCMNNFTFGNDRFGYYETIGGGAGAGSGWHGQSGVHTHMTNTRITDPEILERRYPVLLREFSIRQQSGGSGEFQGGDGLVREMEFLEPLNVAILSERRVFAPYGLAGGKPGAQGANTFIRKDGRHLNLGGKNEIRAEAGDAIRIQTPGGGGFGKATVDPC
jgi:5-oxoprolinase (ATP-hydrolysing)